MYVLKHGNEILEQTINPIIYTDGVWQGGSVNYSDPEQQFTLEVTPDVPQTITKWQAELILHDMGMLPAVQTVISTDPAMSIVYDGVTTFDRSNGLITQVATAKDIPDEVIDQMFIAASRYTAEMAPDQTIREAIMREVGLVQ